MSALHIIGPVAPDRRLAAAEADRCLRLLAADGYDVHRLVYASCASAGVRDFLYAPYSVAETAYVVYVRRFDVPTRFAEGMAFEMTLRAMPTVKCAGRRRSIGASQVKDPLRVRWIMARARQHGFTLLAPRRSASSACGSRGRSGPSDSTPASTASRSVSPIPTASPAPTPAGSDRAGRGGVEW